MKFVFLFVFMAAQPLWAWKVFIDPGHGGNDHGAVYSGLKEAQVNLQISERVQRLLEGDSRFEVKMSRTQDETLTLAQRIQTAESQKADLILSIHANASVDPRARGVEIYVQNPLPSEEEALFLAHQESQILQTQSAATEGLSKSQDVAAIIEDLHRQNKFLKSLEMGEVLRDLWQARRPKTTLSIRQAPFYMISQGLIPSVLVEVGFLSHSAESQQLKSSAHQDEISQIIYLSVLQYFGESDLTRP